jgi:hypothetical protein
MMLSSFRDLLNKEKEAASGSKNDFLMRNYDEMWLIFYKEY